MAAATVPVDERAAAVAAQLPGVDVVTDPQVLESYRFDQAAPGLIEAGRPGLLVRPRSTREIQQAVRAASRHDVAVVPRGAGTGLSGGANAVDGCLVLCLERMDAIIDVDRWAMTATVEPGVLNGALRGAAQDEQLFYAPDPASADICTIGGNIATNAGGLCCIKYGVTRDALLGLEVVLASGEHVWVGRRTRKSAAGYDLTSLLCGSEGTLAIVARATVRLLPPPRPATTLAASFRDLEQAGTAVARIVRSLTPSLLELVDEVTLAAVEAYRPMGLDATAALLFARSDAGQVAGREEIAWIERLCREAGAELVVTTDDQAEARMLLAARTLAHPALERQGSALLDDVAVAPGRLAALLRGVAQVAERRELTIGTFGHAGEGNLHPTIIYDHHDDESVSRARDAFDDILALALSLGGTITGEHGVGALKRSALGAELGSAVSLHHSIKRALDPAGLLNPGKALPL